jgi:hypothetical protein
LYVSSCATLRPAIIGMRTVFLDLVDADAASLLLLLLL